MPRVDVVIPTYKPNSMLFVLIEKLNHQTILPGRIIIMNTEEKYFDTLIYGTHFFDTFKNVEVTHLSKYEFDHGRTRNKGIQKSDADFVLLMTQDALICDDTLIETMLHALEDPQVAVAYARQLPHDDCEKIERFNRSFNYPQVSRVKWKKDIPELGIKTFFCSNVCAMYRRKTYEELGGFIRHTIFNEDMIFAAGAIEAGYGVAYVADACVKHSHNYTGADQFHRNFDLGVSQADHPEIFEKIKSESEGKKLVKRTMTYLKESRQLYLAPGFIWACMCRYAGYLLGKRYKKLPYNLVKRWSGSPNYWK